jgi:hypothetical protein
MQNGRQTKSSRNETLYPKKKFEEVYPLFFEVPHLGLPSTKVQTPQHTYVQVYLRRPCATYFLILAGPI